MSRLSLNEVRSEVLSASTLQPSDQPTAMQIRVVITQTVRQFGCRGCAARMAQAFGDTPETAVMRMRWALRVVGDVFPTARPTVPHRFSTGGRAAA
jgi:hypothetical protein